MSENLGPTSAWQIRDCPEAVRKMVVEQARVEEVAVADLVTRLVLDARENGWTFAGSTRFANPSNGSDQDRLRAAVDAVCRLAEAGVPVRREAVTAVGRAVVTVLRDVAPSVARVRALAGPEGGE